MKKLRNKVFWTIYSIMTGAVLLAVIIYNVQSYMNMEDFIVKNMNSAFVDPRFIDFVLQGYANNLRSSIIVFLIFAVIFFFIVRTLTNWIVKPAEVAFEKQKDFIADASHELKTPLSVIIASGDALEKNPTETKWIKNIKEEAGRMNNLISKLLELASTEKTNIENFHEGNLSKTVELAALTFEGRAIEKNCKLSLNIQKEIYHSYIENDIKELVEILLDNAVKHSTENSVIELFLNKTNRTIKLNVSNEGEGIAKGDEEKIFERFYRTDKVRDSKEKRYGLGLSIAKNIVVNHNGEISAHSSNGKTIFSVILK